MRTVSAAFLALMLAVTSYGFASARAHAPASHAMEICTGFSMVTIWVDEDGEPVEERHICPDAISFLVDAGAPVAAPEFEPNLLGVIAPVAPIILQTREELSPSARGPPFLA
ncbi:MAG: hypothetical protein ACWA47_00130 [Brevirhabdus sp.]